MRWVEAVVRARFLVAALGESSTPPWWRTDALTPVGQRMLARLFPRTCIGAGLETAGRAAQIEHDSHIGRHGVYHLFRLPIGDETAIRDYLRLPATEDILQDLVTLVEPSAPIGNRRSAQLEVLRSLGNGEASAGTQGPVHCGTIAGIRRGKVLPRLCATYTDAFATEGVAYPFLTEAPSL